MFKKILFFILLCVSTNYSQVDFSELFSIEKFNSADKLISAQFVESNDSTKKIALTFRNGNILKIASYDLDGNFIELKELESSSILKSKFYKSSFENKLLFMLAHIEQVYINADTSYYNLELKIYDFENGTIIDSLTHEVGYYFYQDNGDEYPIREHMQINNFTDFVFFESDGSLDIYLGAETEYDSTLINEIPFNSKRIFRQRPILLKYTLAKNSLDVSSIKEGYGTYLFSQYINNKDFIISWDLEVSENDFDPPGSADLYCIRSVNKINPENLNEVESIYSDSGEKRWGLAWYDGHETNWMVKDLQLSNYELLSSQISPIFIEKRNNWDALLGNLGSPVISYSFHHDYSGILFNHEDLELDSFFDVGTYILLNDDQSETGYLLFRNGLNELTIKRALDGSTVFEGTSSITPISITTFDKKIVFITEESNIFKFYSASSELLTSVSTADDNNLPTGFLLYQNYPNPFNPVTKINYSLAQPGYVKLIVYNILGKEVAILVDGYKTVGSNFEVTFDGSQLTSGVYFYQIQAGKFTETKKMILMK
jgi:hypothetical protein